MGRRLHSNISQKWHSIQHKISVNNDGCWIWNGYVNSSGYGMVICENMTDLPQNSYHVTVHKLSYLYHYGRLPKDCLIMHNCDCRQCCNPQHLTAGTHLQNSHDARSRGRLRGVDYIKTYGKTRGEFALELGIAPATLSNRLKKWGNPYYNPTKR